MFGIPQKKTRIEAPKAAAPRLFVPFRAIGYVTNEVPFNIQARGQAYFLTTCVGTTFHIYDVAKMNLLFVGTFLVPRYILSQEADARKEPNQANSDRPIPFFKMIRRTYVDPDHSIGNTW